MQQAEQGDRQREQGDKTESSGTQHGSQDTSKATLHNCLLAFVIAQTKQGGPGSLAAT